MYGKNKYTAVGVEQKLALIEIGSIPNREGQYLRNELINRFYRDGRPEHTRFLLSVAPIKEHLVDLDITTESDATRGQLKLTTALTLKDTRTNETLLQRNLQSITSYNILNSEFASRVSEDNARTNALDDIARQIEQQINLHLKHTQ